MQNASVTVVNTDTGFRRITRSRSNGGYVVASLQPGLYKITVRKEGFRTLIRFDVKLDAAQPVQLDFTLTLGSVREVVTVSGAPAVINSDDASVGTIIHRERIEKLPLNGRGLLSLLEFAPGTVVTPATRGEAGQFTASGQRANANYFTVDGVSANNGVSAGGHPAQSTGGSLPGMTAMGSLHGLISLEALNEFRVQTSTATPEFGKLPGAQVVLSSRAGSNEFHGSLFQYFRTGNLDAADWFANSGDSTAAALRMNDFGATVGGPLKRNRVFFFLSYEGMRLREPFAWHAPVPTAETKLEAPEWTQPVLNLFPLPNGGSLGENFAEWRGQNDRSGRFDVASARLDAAVTSRLTVFARYNRAWSANQFTSIQVNDLTINADSFTFGANMRLSPGAVLDFKLNRSRASGRSDWRLPDGLSGTPCYLAPVSQQQFRDDRACDSLVRISIAGLGQIVIGPEADQRQRQWHLLPTGTFVFGGHQLKVGMDYRHYTPERRDHQGTLSVIGADFEDFIGQRPLWWGIADQLTLSSNLTEYSAFAQDTWRMHPRLTATFGLRWEYSRSPDLRAP
ncbi:MAG: TonB-dependent receptor, partial [bacterium]|nr:TonB-dependent receptor [bacterium]